MTHTSSSTDEISVLLAADRAYEIPLAVTVASLSATHTDRPCRAFVVVAPDLEAGARTRIEQGAENLVAIDWIEAPDASLSEAQLPRRVTRAALYRLMIADLLPHDVGRVIYLDSDLVVRGSLRELWIQELDGALAAGVRDGGWPLFAPVPQLPWREMGLPPQSPYYNTGVLLCDVEGWRRDDVGSKALALIRKRRLAYADQDAINLVLHDRWVNLTPDWNVQTAFYRALDRSTGLAFLGDPLDALEAAVSNPRVIHYTEPIKPWHAHCDHPLRSAWLETLQQTAWRGWQPRPSLRMASSFVRNARRAVRVLRQR